MTSPKRLAKQTSRSSRVAGNKKFTASHKIDFGQSPSPPSRSPSRPAGSAQVRSCHPNARVVPPRGQPREKVELAIRATSGGGIRTPSFSRGLPV
jgi:hypothetical protein